MRSLAILVLALCLYECRAMTFETVDNDNSKCVAPQNTTSKYDSCVSSYYNQELNVDNVHEFKLDMEEILKVRADYENDVRPYLHTGKSTKDFCLTTPYDANRKVWDNQNDNNKKRSDMKWYSPLNEETFDRYMAHVERLGLKDLVKGFFVDGDVSVYNILFLVRSHSDKYHFHLDWSEELGTQSLTFLVPLNNFSIHMKYYDNDDEVQQYKYKMGTGVGFGGGFLHSTDIGHGEEEDVLLCVYLGGNDPDLWEYVQDNIGDEAGYYVNPFKGFVRNENVSKKTEICL
jgi:hypothetical protein